MTVKLKVPRTLLSGMRNDLSRRHAHAAERVGIAYGRLAAADSTHPLVLVTGYVSLADERYLADPLSGARIDSTAIRQTMQGIIDRQEGAFHVHMHHGRGQPIWSRMDLAELPRLIPSFQVVGKALAHGLILLSADSCNARIWLPQRSDPVSKTEISVVGYPMQLI